MTNVTDNYNELPSAAQPAPEEPINCPATPAAISSAIQDLIQQANRTDLALDLPDVDLSNANLSQTDLQEACLIEADLREAGLSGAILPGANSTQTDPGEARQKHISGERTSETNPKPDPTV